MQSLEDALSQTQDYLGSAQALRSLEVDAYWPKWDSPWWHMLLLHEMGETRRIPAPLVERYVAALDRMPLKIFPIHPADLPAGVDPHRGVPCHCQLGHVYQVLAAWGVDVDREMPWIRPWFLRYQMADGGLNCDEAAYLVPDEVPSSMVATLPAFEAVLRHTPRPWTEPETAFLQRAAGFLVQRKLTRGSDTRYNAAERQSAEAWIRLCFPRFYLYDVLRGLDALLQWGEQTGQTVPPEAYLDVATALEKRFPDGQVRLEREAFAGIGTIVVTPAGEKVRGQPATRFALLTAVSAVGEVSPFLSQQWASVRQRLARTAAGQALLAEATGS